MSSRSSIGRRVSDTMRKRSLVARVIGGARENSAGAVLFHQAAGRSLGISVTDMKCLDILIVHGSASPSHLAAVTGLSTGSTTAMIDRLQEKRIVERHPNANDRRGTIVVITKRSARRLSALFASLARAMHALVSSYSESELLVLADYFAKVGVLWKSERAQLQRHSGKRTSSTRTAGKR